MLKIIQSKIFWGFVIFCSTLLLPWRTIYKGTSVFAVLPLWWEYGNPLENITVILGHITISIICGIVIAKLIWLFLNRKTTQ